MSFTETNTVEQMILDALSSRSGGPLVLREAPPGWGESRGDHLLPLRWTPVPATQIPRQPGDVMVDTNLSAAKAREKRLRLIGAGLTVRIAFAVIDPLRQEARM